MQQQARLALCGFSDEREFQHMTLCRRIVAYIADCACIMWYAAMLFFATTLVVKPEMTSAQTTVVDAFRFQLVGLLTLTLPVVVVFAWLEAGGGHGTIGKRLCNLRVTQLDGSDLSMRRSLARNALKFLPWEISHTGVHQMFVPDHPLPWLGPMFAIAGMGLVLLYFVTCLFGDGRTIYDRAAGAKVRDGKLSGGWDPEFC